MKRRPWIRISVFVALVAWACGGSSLSGGDSETHWLSACQDTLDCEDDGQCVCGICTKACNVSGGCSEVSSQAVCLPSAAVDLCNGTPEAPAGLCIEACATVGDCSAGLDCVAGACLRGASAPSVPQDSGTPDANSMEGEDDGGTSQPLNHCAESGVEMAFDSDAEFMTALLGRWLTCEDALNFLGDGSEDGFDLIFDENTLQYEFHTVFSEGVTGPDLRWSDSPNTFGTVTVPGFVVGEVRELDFNFASGDVISVLAGQLTDPRKLTVVPGPASVSGLMQSSHAFAGPTPAPSADGGTGSLDSGSMGGELGDLPTVAPSTGCGTVPPLDGTYEILTSGTKPADCANETCGFWTSNREYSIFLPAGYDANHPYSLVFEGPGCGGSSTTIYPYDNNANNTVIRIGVEPSAEVQVSHSVYPGFGCFDTHDGDNSVDWVLYEILYDLLETQLCFDKNRVFAGGNSIGAFFANELACRYAGDAERPIRGVLSNAGGLPDEPQHRPTCSSAGTAGLWVHELYDSTIPFERSKDAINRAMAVSGCSAGQTYDTATFEDFPIGGIWTRDTCQRILGCDPLFPLVVCAIDGTEHRGNELLVDPAGSTFLQSFLAPPLAQ